MVAISQISSSALAEHAGYLTVNLPYNFESAALLQEKPGMEPVVQERGHAAVLVEFDRATHCSVCHGVLWMLEEGYASSPPPPPPFSLCTSRSACPALPLLHRGVVLMMRSAGSCFGVFVYGACLSPEQGNRQCHVGGKLGSKLICTLSTDAMSQRTHLTRYITSADTCAVSALPCATTTALAKRQHAR